MIREKLLDAIDARDHAELRRIFAAHPQEARAAHWRSHARMLFKVITLNDPLMTRIFLEGGVGADMRNPFSTPLMEAICQDACIEVIDVLLEFGADTRVRDYEGDTALHHAAASGRLDAATALVRAGCDINATNDDLQTPLHLAAAMSKHALMEFLLECRAKDDIADRWSKTARDQVDAFNCAARKIGRVAAKGIAAPLPAAPKIGLRKANEAKR